jgi:hypothetical protein
MPEVIKGNTLLRSRNQLTFLNIACNLSKIQVTGNSERLLERNFK